MITRRFEVWYGVGKLIEKVVRQVRKREGKNVVQYRGKLYELQETPSGPWIDMGAPLADA